MYDITKFFDKLWLFNDLFDKGLDNDKLVLLYKENIENKVSVKTPYGKTDEFCIDNVIMQGTIFGPLICTTSMSKLGDLSYQHGKSLLTYKFGNLKKVFISDFVFLGSKPGR